MVYIVSCLSTYVYTGLLFMEGTAGWPYTWMGSITKEVPWPHIQGQGTTLQKDDGIRGQRVP